MSDVTNKRVHIYIDNASAETALQNLQTKADGFNKKIDEARKKQKELNDEIIKIGPNGKGIEKLDAEYKKLTANISINTAKLKENENAQAKIKQQIDSGLSPSFSQLERHVAKLRNELKNLSQDAPEFAGKFEQFRKSSLQLNNLRDSFNGVEKAQKSWLSNVGQIGLGVVIGNTLQSALMAFSSFTSGIVSGNAKLSDSLSDIEKSTGLSAEGVKKLNSELGKIDTRTPTSDLREIAIGLGQVGEAASKEAVKALDQINVALGDEFSGGARQITKTLSVLRNNLGDIKSGNYADDISKIGNAINVLGAEGLAEGEKTVDIANRISGVLGTFKVSSGTILGYAATFQELGIEVERGSTAIVKLYQKMASEPEKFAKVAGVSTSQFKKMIDEDIVAAFNKVTEGAKKAGTSNSNFAAILKELDADGSGAGEVISKIGANQAMLAQKTKLATDALTNNNSITDEFTKKNNNLAANLEKLGKNISSWFTSSGLSDFFGGLVKGLVDVTAKSKNANEVFEDQLTKMVKLKTNIEPLLPRYEELAAKTTRSKDEQVEMNKIINQVSSIYPGAISQVDAYGNAIAISTSRVREYIDTESARLKVMNKDAISNTTKELNKAIDQSNAMLSKIEEINKKGTYSIKVEGESIGGGKKTEAFFREATQQEVAEIQKRYQNIRTAIIGYNAEIKRLNGDALKEQLKANEEASKANLEKRKKDAEDQKKLLANANNLDFSNDKKDKKSQADKDKEDALKDLQRLRDAMKELERDLALNGFSEYEKGLSDINRKYEELFNQLQKNSKSTADDFFRLNDSWTEAVQQFNDKQLKAVDDFVKKRNDLLNTQNDKDNYEKDVNDIKQHYQFLINQHNGNTEEIKKLERERGIELSRIKLFYEYKKEISDIDRVFNEQVERFKGNTEALKTLEEQRAKELAKAKAKYDTNYTEIGKGDSGNDSSTPSNKSAKWWEKKQLNEEEQGFLEAVDKVVEYANRANDILNNFAQARNAREQAQLNREIKQNEERKKSIQNLVKSKVISEIEGRRQMNEIDKESEQKKEELEKKQAERNKRFARAQALINGFQAVTRAAAEYPFPFSLIPIAFAVATTAAQVASINNTKFGKGGKLTGPLHSDGGMPVINPTTGQKEAEVEGGEYILSRSTVANNKALADSLLYSSMYNNGKTISYMPAYTQRPYQAINFSGISQAIATNKSFAKGGEFNVAQQPPQQQIVIQQNENIERAIYMLIKKLDEPIKTETPIITLKQITETQDYKANMLKQAGYGFK